MTQFPVHPTEHDLILYQMHEAADEAAIGRHLDLCPACAELADSIAHTLRVFSAEPVPSPDLDRAWQRLRPQLPALDAVPASRFRLLRPGFRLLRWPAVAGLAAMLFVSLFLARHHAPPPMVSQRTTARSGPLTPRPVDPAVAAHLDSAERFLTEVSHTAEPLDPVARQQAHTLLVQNAVFVRTAHETGDLADAAVLEKLGRVLTTVDHDPEPAEPAWHIRFEINANGLLLDLRILRQNETRHHQGDLP